MIKNSEAFDSARNEYIEGYEEKNDHTFPTLSLAVKEFNPFLYLQFFGKKHDPIN